MPLQFFEQHKIQHGTVDNVPLWQISDLIRDFDAYFRKHRILPYRTCVNITDCIPVARNPLACIDCDKNLSMNIRMIKERMTNGKHYLATPDFNYYDCIDLLAHEFVHLNQIAKRTLSLTPNDHVIFKGKKYHAGIMYITHFGRAHEVPWEVEPYAKMYKIADDFRRKTGWKCPIQHTVNTEAKNEMWSIR